MLVITDNFFRVKSGDLLIGKTFISQMNPIALIFLLKYCQSLDVDYIL